MLAKARARSHDYDQLEDIIITLDSEAQNSFIATHADTRLRLAVANIRSCASVALKGQKFSEATEFMQLTLVDLFVEELTSHVMTKHIFTLAQNSLQLEDEDESYIRKHAYDMPVCHSQEGVLPELLIGIDNYWHVLTQETPVVLPSGMF